MTTNELIQILQKMDPTGSAEVLEERDCELRSLKVGDVRMDNYQGNAVIQCDDGEEFDGCVIVLTSWS
ncbi:MAG: hypothetical protein ACYTGS_18480 [Planctomycetota bacterium]|jgi:hypothetical protein